MVLRTISLFSLKPSFVVEEARLNWQRDATNKFVMSRSFRTFEHQQGNLWMNYELFSLCMCAVCVVCMSWVRMCVRVRACMRACVCVCVCGNFMAICIMLLWYYNVCYCVLCTYICVLTSVQLTHTAISIVIMLVNDNMHRMHSCPTH